MDKLKKRGNAWYSTLEVDVFCTAVLVIIAGTKEDYFEALPKIYNDFDNIPDEHKQKDINTLSDMFSESYLYDRTVQFDNPSGDVIITLCSKSPKDVLDTTIVHETHHAAHDICLFRGVDDEETETYTQVCLYDQLMTQLRLWGQNQKTTSKEQ